jgi:hypothetical protein
VDYAHDIEGFYDIAWIIRGVAVQIRPLFVLEWIGL